MGGAPLAEVVRTTTAYVDPLGMPDYVPTGMQVWGGQPILRKLAVAESCNLTTIRAAADWGAEALLVHHGVYWHAADPAGAPGKVIEERRMEALRAAGISLLAYHLPLDAHPEVGNNACIARELGLEVTHRDFCPIGESGMAIGVIGAFPEAVALTDLAHRCGEVFGTVPLTCPGAQEQVRSVAIVSGGGASSLFEAAARGVDAFISGEGREWSPAAAAETGVAFLAVGHHASEQLGVQALAAWIAQHHGVAWRFFPEENPF